MAHPFISNLIGYCKALIDSPNCSKSITVLTITGGSSKVMKIQPDIVTLSLQNMMF